MAEDVGHRVREIVYPNWPVEYCGRSQKGQRKGVWGCTQFSALKPHIPVCQRLTLHREQTAAHCPLLKRGWAMLTCPKGPPSLSLISLGWCPQHLSLFSLSSITATWATAWVGKHFELKLSLCQHLELSLNFVFPPASAIQETSGCPHVAHLEPGGSQRVWPKTGVRGQGCRGKKNLLPFSVAFL